MSLPYHKQGWIWKSQRERDRGKWGRSQTSEKFLFEKFKNAREKKGGGGGNISMLAPLHLPLNRLEIISDF